MLEVNLNENYKEISEKLQDLCESNYLNMVKLRRDFHKYPETNWDEFRTTAKIAEYMENIGLKVFLGKDIINLDNVLGYPENSLIEAGKIRAVNEGALQKYIKKMGGYTGVVAILDTGLKGKTTAFRFDIDANSVNECNDESHRPYRENFSSIHAGVGHCCGHDGHITIGIACAEALSKIKDKLVGKILFVFQPAEEGVKGGKAIASSGILDDVDNLFAGHIAFQAKSNNQIITGVKGFLATKKMEVVFMGKSSHAGAAPEKGKNALLAAASATLAMHTMCQDGRGVSRINVGCLNSGTGLNVIADYAKIEMEVRGETTEICENTYKNCINALEGAAKMYSVSVKHEIIGEAFSGESDDNISNFVADSAKELYPNVDLKSNIMFGASEDAIFLMKAVQNNGGNATYTMLGSQIAAEHHNSKFDFDEQVLLFGTKIYTNCALKLHLR